MKTPEVGVNMAFVSQSQLLKHPHFETRRNFQGGLLLWSWDKDRRVAKRVPGMVICFESRSVVIVERLFHKSKMFGQVLLMLLLLVVNGS